MNNNNTTLNIAETSSNQQKIREDLVNAAKQFLNNPRVKYTPLEEQKTFLRRKGLTDYEINEAMKEIIREDQKQGISLNDKTIPGSFTNTKVALDWAKAIIIIGSTSYIFYRFVRTWILPNFFGLKNPENERIENIEKQIVSITETNKAIVESVKQTIGTICEQNEQINRSLLIIQSQTRNNYLNDDKVTSTDSTRLLSEIGIIKSLLLNQNQFPPIPEHSLIPPSQQNGLVKSKIEKINNNECYKNGGKNLEINDDGQEDEEYQDLDKSSGSQV